MRRMRSPRPRPWPSSDLSRPENVFERTQGRLLEVYRAVWTPSGEPLPTEAYFRYDDVPARGNQLWRGSPAAC